VIIKSLGVGDFLISKKDKKEDKKWKTEKEKLSHQVSQCSLQHWVLQSDWGIYGSFLT